MHVYACIAAMCTLYTTEILQKYWFHSFPKQVNLHSVLIGGRRVQWDSELVIMHEFPSLYPLFSRQ